MVCFTLEEQDEIINELLDVIEANDLLIQKFKNIFERCST